MVVEATTRSSGILLHPSSLPGRFGVGDFGPDARRWIDLLAQAGQTWWQILPLGPTGFGDSPYQCYSALAGSSLLISPECLVEEGLLDDGPPDVDFPEHAVDFGNVMAFKDDLLNRAWERFCGSAGKELRADFDTFQREQADWLDEYALFMAIKRSRGGAGWHEWPDPIRRRDASAVAAARRELVDAIQQQKFRQFLFFRQWSNLKLYAAERGIRLIGDIPIFVSGDSADVWANPELFLLNKEHRPAVVAGVPPDYFCKTGQLWGNPHYDWDKHRETGYAWWLSRVRATLQQVDWIRLDHFCGFESAWHVPAGHKTAEKGKYVAGPGADLFESLKKQLGGLPFIAEDLGTVTPEVEALRDQFELPGMRVLHFAFGDTPKNPFLPHNHVRNAVVYTGTHDNNTSIGWYEEIGDDERDYFRRYAARDGSDVAWSLMRMAWASVADVAIAPLQDVLRAGGEARMNMPGRAAGNWGWRFTWEAIEEQVPDELLELTSLYGRARSDDEES